MPHLDADRCSKCIADRLAMNYSAFVCELVEISGRFGDTRPHLVDYCPASHATALIQAHHPLSYPHPFSFFHSVPCHSLDHLLLFCLSIFFCFLSFLFLIQPFIQPSFRVATFFFPSVPFLLSYLSFPILFFL